MKPLVSIIIPCFNMGQYLDKALSSIAEQTYEHWEVLLVDDSGPEDGTKEKVLLFAKDYPKHRIEYIRHEINKGVSAARNTGIRHSKGELIALLDPDDFWTERHLEISVRHFQQDSSIYLYAAYANLFYDDRPSEVFGLEGYEEWELSLFPNMLCIRNAIPTSSVVIKATVFDDVEYFDERIAFGEDYDLWVRIIAKGYKLSLFKEATTYYRKHANAATLQSKRKNVDRVFFAEKNRDWLLVQQRAALEAMATKITAVERQLLNNNRYIQSLEKRILIIEQTIRKFKSLPVLKQFFELKSRIG